MERNSQIINIRITYVSCKPPNANGRSLHIPTKSRIHTPSLIPKPIPIYVSKLRKIYFVLVVGSSFGGFFLYLFPGFFFHQFHLSFASQSTFEFSLVHEAIISM